MNPDVTSPDNLPVMPFDGPQAWTDWLHENHAASAGIWLRLAKKESGIPSITYDEALDVALRYGWIDGKARRCDDVTYMQRFTPRSARSVWSKRNRARVEQLIANGHMQPAGLAAVESARQDGRWDAAYDSPATATVPDDLQAALDANPAAAAFFATLSGTNRYAILYRIQTARKAETRRKRIRQFVDMLARHETLYP